MDIILTHDLFVDLFRRDRRMSRRIHETARRLASNGTACTPVRWLIHSELLRRLDHRAGVLLNAPGTFTRTERDAACDLKVYLELLSFLTATDPSLLAEKQLFVGDLAGADSRINRAAAAAKLDLAPRIRNLSIDYTLRKEESVTVAFAIYGQAVLFHPHGSLEREMLESYCNILREPLPPLWIPRTPHHHPPPCMTIFASNGEEDSVIWARQFSHEAGTQPVEIAAKEGVVEGMDPMSLKMFPFLSIGHAGPMGSLFDHSSAPVISDALAEALKKKC